MVNQLFCGCQDSACIILFNFLYLYVLFLYKLWVWKYKAGYFLCNTLTHIAWHRILVALYHMVSIFVDNCYVFFVLFKHMYTLDLGLLKSINASFQIPIIWNILTKSVYNILAAWTMILKLLVESSLKQIALNAYFILDCLSNLRF